MPTRDELYSIMLVDLPGRVLPNPAGEPLTFADLMQCALKFRGFHTEEVPGAGAPVAGESFIPVIRRRRR